MSVNKNEDDRISPERPVQVFVAWVKLDKESGKYKKVPGVPKGVSWKTYVTPPELLASATNLGVMIPDGLVLLDLDLYKGITREMVEEVLGCKPDWDSSLVQYTVSKGEHHIFALPDGVSVRQMENALGLKGFDTRAANTGWMGTGEGYCDMTVLGLVDTLKLGDFPLLPDEAIAKLGGTEVVEGEVVGASVVEDEVEDGLEDLSRAVALRPVGLGIGEMYEYLKLVPYSVAEDHDSWYRVGMAIHLETDGSLEGLKLWRAWSKTCPEKFNGDECNKRWQSFANRDHIVSPVRFDYVIALAGGVIERVAEGGDGVGVEGGGERGEGGEGRPSGKGRPSWVKPWVYVTTRDMFHNTDANYAITKSAFNSSYSNQPDVITSKKYAATLAFLKYRIPQVEDVMFWPGAERVFPCEGKMMVNTYRQSGVELIEGRAVESVGAVDRLLAHLRLLIDDEREALIVLDFITYVYQNPGKRVGWALLIQGAQGSGKSYFLQLMRMLMGSLVGLIDSEGLLGRFTGWAHGHLVVGIEEVYVDGKSKYDVMGKLKPFVSNPVVSIECKGRDIRTLPNFTSYFMLTNHVDALPLVAGDRRYCVIFSCLGTRERLFSALGGREGMGAYFGALFGDLESEGGQQELVRWFKERKVSTEFSPHGYAPETRGLVKMTENSVSAVTEAVDSAISVFECDVINSEIVDLTYLVKLALAEGMDLGKTAALKHAMAELGYERVEGGQIRINKTREKHTFYAKSGGSIWPTREQVMDKANEFHG